MKSMPAISILPVIMSGGAGSRLWPLSRKAKPKQLLPLLSDQTLIQETVVRLTGEMFLPPVFICNASHALQIETQMSDIGQEIGAIIVEPIGRNTAPCAVIAALQGLDMAAQIGSETLVLLLPADHHVKDPKAFQLAISNAVNAARSGYLVTFGITPDRAETGYGYIETDAPIDTHAAKVIAFREKPDLETAQSYLASGRHAWNAGIFMFAPQTLLSEMQSYAPDIYEKSRASFVAARIAGHVRQLDADIFATLDGQSIDYAVMEHTRKAAMIPADIGWTDIGSFLSLYDERKTAEGLAISGDVITHNVSNSLIFTDGPLVAAIGVQGLSIIVEDNKILISPLDQTQDVKKIVEHLKKQGRTDKL